MSKASETASNRLYSASRLREGQGWFACSDAEGHLEEPGGGFLRAGFKNLFQIEPHHLGAPTKRPITAHHVLSAIAMNFWMGLREDAPIVHAGIKGRIVVGASMTTVAAIDNVLTGNVHGHQYAIIFLITL